MFARRFVLQRQSLHTVPSVAAGGWFAHLAQTIDGPKLRDVMRQHDPADRAALAEVHDGKPNSYIALMRERADRLIHAREANAISGSG
jgi:AAA domain